MSSKNFGCFRSWVRRGFLECLCLCLGLAGAELGRAAERSPMVAFERVTRATDGRLRFQFASSTNAYYVLYRSLTPDFTAQLPLAIRFGDAGSTVLTEALGAAGAGAYYRVREIPRSAPVDTDGDGLDDVTELQTPVELSALNPAKRIAFRDGVATLPDRVTYKELSYQGDQVAIDTHLKGWEFVKFQIEKANTTRPELFFINTVTHRSHPSFMSAVGIAGGGRPGSSPGTMRGVMVYRPLLNSPSGTPGLYTIEFEPNDAFPFERIQLAHELVAANAPFLANNLAYNPIGPAITRVNQEKALYAQSRIPIFTAEDVFGDIGYLPVNVSEAYGRLRLMGPADVPTARDIALYTALPNELPRVAGFITEVPQTPLSHVNLRAIQDNSPNAYIAGASKLEAIAALIGKNVYYRVAADGYELREASIAEVDRYFADLRPTNPQVPVRDLSLTNILALDEIQFADSTRFGVKVANLATLRKPVFAFPAGTIPDGFGVPFFFYDEFMKFNGFYEEIAALLADPNFRENRDVQETQLAAFRKRLRDGQMPDWMLAALGAVQARFAAGTEIRCRSSTNNEDLPGFSGAGLYDSFTHHLDEGHLSKSIKQVYASLWNFRAFEEREFFRVDHLATAMGVLLHPNFSDEKANGVAVSKDPIYQTQNTYYVNAQLGEDLVTNPDALSAPEEVLVPSTGGAVTRVRASSLVPEGTPVVTDAQLGVLRLYLTRIVAQFRGFYGVAVGQPFAMEIEFKITPDGNVAIKQTRPWLN